MQGAGFHSIYLRTWELQPVQGLCAACRESSAEGPGRRTFGSDSARVMASASHLAPSTNMPFT